jgi:hypothetical protein
MPEDDIGLILTFTRTANMVKNTGGKMNVRKTYTQTNLNLTTLELDNLKVQSEDILQAYGLKRKDVLKMTKSCVKKENSIIHQGVHHQSEKA